MVEKGEKTKPLQIKKFQKQRAMVENEKVLIFMEKTKVGIWQCLVMLK